MARPWVGREVIEKIRQMKADGKTHQQVREVLHVSNSTINRYARKRQYGPRDLDRPPCRVCGRDIAPRGVEITKGTRFWCEVYGEHG